MVFTLKADLSEGALTPRQLERVRGWAEDIYSVAVQEMLHLAQAWKLLGAIGGTPYYLRPNFPQGTKYYPIEAELKLEPFGRRALQRFLSTSGRGRRTKDLAAVSRPGPRGTGPSGSL